jgi:hypothetical protein
MRQPHRDVGDLVHLDIPISLQSEDSLARRCEDPAIRKPHGKTRDFKSTVEDFSDSKESGSYSVLEMPRAQEVREVVAAENSLTMPVQIPDAHR